MQILLNICIDDHRVYESAQIHLSCSLRLFDLCAASLNVLLVGLLLVLQHVRLFGLHHAVQSANNWYAYYTIIASGFAGWKDLDGPRLSIDKSIAIKSTRAASRCPDTAVEGEEAWHDAATQEGA